MIIVSQNRKYIVNFDNMDFIYINEYNDCCIECQVNNNWIRLGEYATADECQKVFTDLMMDISMYSASNMPISRIYMPLIDEVNLVDEVDTH